MIGIICAEREEMEMLEADMELTEKKTVSGREFVIGKLYEKDTVVCMARVGKVAAAVSAALIIDRFGAEKVIVAGAAGGCDSALNVGDIVVSDKLCQHDMDSVFNPLFMIPLVKKIYFEADKTLVGAACAAAEKFLAYDLKELFDKKTLERFGIKEPVTVTGTVASGDQFICNEEKRKWLQSKIDGLKCCEMEGAAVAQVCDDFGVPFVCIRAVSDSANRHSTFAYDDFLYNIIGKYTRGVIKRMYAEL